MMIKDKFGWIIIFLHMVGACLAGQLVISKYAGAFLEIGVGARSLGMGGASVAVSNDVTAIYWNPAGLAYLGNVQFHGMHSERFGGVVNWDFIGLGIPLKDKTRFGVGFFRLGVDDIPYTALRNPSMKLGESYVNELGQSVQNVPYVYRTVSDQEMALYLSFAKRKTNKITWGINIKIIRKVMGDYDAWGLGFDAGVRVNPIDSIQIGLVLLDGTYTLIGWNKGRKELIVPHIRYGLAYPLNFTSIQLLPTMDIIHNFDNQGSASQISTGRLSLDLFFGLECEYRDLFALRIGLNRGKLSTGVGFQASFIGIDYGFSSQTDLGHTHRISLTITMNKSFIKSF